VKPVVIAALCLAIGAVADPKPAESEELGLSVTYVFKGGAVFGQVLEAQAGSEVVDPGDNPNSLAFGAVEEPNADCSARHYVGEFQGLPTPKNDAGVTKSCGWGKLSRVDPGPGPLRSYAEAWTSTETAHRVQLGLRDLGGSANTDAAAQLVIAALSLELLGGQLDALKQSGQISKEERQAIEKRRAKALERIAIAAGGLATLVAKPAIESRKASLVQLLVLRSLVLAKSELTKMLTKMESAGLLPGAQ
jgi:hypothetical protein